MRAAWRFSFQCARSPPHRASLASSRGHRTLQRRTTASVSSRATRIGMSKPKTIPASRGCRTTPSNRMKRRSPLSSARSTRRASKAASPILTPAVPVDANVVVLTELAVVSIERVNRPRPYNRCIERRHPALASNQSLARSAGSSGRIAQRMVRRRPLTGTIHTTIVWT